MLDALTEDYVRTARAKGASTRRVLYGHALRNALLPILTLSGCRSRPSSAARSITENVFNYPGMGLLTVQAALNDDIPLVLGTTLVITVATVLGSLLADILYAVADPRIRLGSDDEMTQPTVRLRSSTTSRSRLALPIGTASMPARAGGATPAPEGGEALPAAASSATWPGSSAENKLAVVSLGVIVFMVLFCFVGPLHLPTNQTNSQEALQNSTQNAPPGSGHPLGTDETGFDILGSAHVRRSGLAHRRLRLGAGGHRHRRHSTARSAGSSAAGSTRC